MNPLAIKPLVLAAAIGAALLIGFGAGWSANGWRLGVQVAELKTDAAEKQAKTATDALVDLETGMKRVADAAQSAQFNVGNVNAQLTQFRKDFKNANPPPLPPDCRPDAIRMQSLAAAAGAVDQAIARPKPGGAVQAERPAPDPK